ncbi:MAG TPA: serine/threonine-protein kinase, partial [Steroidobacteraceae bacterium]|nr:serine/threonine-protein kinase [Steroidobacteraceae bacterium]
DKVAEVLAHHQAAQLEQFLDGAVVDHSGLADLAGRAFGGYTLVRSLGQGGMGSVWLARRSDGRYEGYAALKLLNLGSLGTHGVERLRHEANALAKLSHPNITHIIDAGVLAGQPYLVLEYVEGDPIDQWCDIQRLGVEARLRLFLQVLAAVSHAHGRLILHRDLKPSNILVTRDGTAKLLDFGIAKLLEGDGQTAAPSELTRMGGAAMTPEYAAPEQLLHAEVTTATDVYALGVLLYVLLVGKHPTASPTGTPMDQMQALVETEPERPSDAATGGYAEVAKLRGTSAQQLSRVLRGDLDNIVAKALKKEPSERYATADAFASDLQRYLNHEPVSARADSFPYRARKFIRRHRVGVSAVSLTVLALVAGIVGTTWQAIEAKRQRDAALYQAKRAEFQGRFAYQIMSEVGSDGRPITIRQLMEKGIEVLERNYGDDPRFVIGTLVSISGRYMDLGDTEGEYASLVKADELAHQLGDPERIAFVQCNTVETELAAGRHEQAAKRMQDGLDNLQRLREPSFDREVDCGMAQARLLWSQNQMDAAIDTAAGIATAIEAQQPGDLGYATVVSMLEVMLAQEGRLREAIAWNERLQRAHERAGRGGTMSMSVTEARHAFHLYQAGNVSDAFRRQKAIVDRLIEQQGIDSVRAATAHQIGLAQVRLQQTDAGLMWLNRAVAAAATQRNQRVHMDALLSRASAQLLLRRHGEALADIEEAERLALKNANDYRSALRGARLLHAQWHMAEGNTHAALEEVDRWLADIGYPQRRVAPGLATALRVKAQAHLQLGQKAVALTTAGAGVAAAEAIAIDAARSADLGDALITLAEVQRATGDFGGARGTAQRAVSVLTSSLG